MASSGAYDVIVVGAGLTGALIASELAAEGLSVVVLEASDDVGGTLKYRAGLATLGTQETFIDAADRWGEERALQVWELTRTNRERLAAQLDQLNLPAERIGSLRLASDPEQSECLRDSVALLRACGYNVDLVDHNGYSDLAAVNTPGDLVFMPQMLVEALLDHKNIVLELEAEVKAIKARSQGGVTVWAHNHYLWADRVVLANGFHATRLDASLSRHLKPGCFHTIKMQNTQDLARPMVFQNGRVCYVPYGDKAYLVGWYQQEREILSELKPVADQLCPNARVYHRFTNWVSHTEDGLPVVGRLPTLDQVYVINGLGPWGLNLATITAHQLIRLMESDEESELFDLERLTS